MDSAFTLAYTYNETYTQDFFAPVGTLKQWLLENRMAPFGHYVDVNDMYTLNRILQSHGGYDGPVKWYQSMLRDYNLADEKGEPTYPPSYDRAADLR